MALDPHASACHLHIQAGAHRRAQHSNQINVWIIKTSGQHVGVGERRYFSLFVESQNGFTLRFGRFTSYALRYHALLIKRVSNVLRMLYASAKEQPRLALTGQRNDLLHHRLILVVGIHSRLQLGLNELTSPLMHASHVQLGLGDLRAQG